MTCKAVPITLVSTVSQSLCRSLHSSLTHLGYLDVDTCDDSAVLDADAQPDRVYVVPFCSDWQSSLPAKMVTVFKRIHHKPVLGVLPASTPQWNNEALRFCNEFLRWPCDAGEIDLRIERLVHLLHTNYAASPDCRIDAAFLSLNLVGSSPAFVHVLQQIKKIVRCDAPVLIEGESGTGKELAARAIHYLSERRDYPFIPVNCGAIPDSLLENELFGHRPGAFTDAKTSQPGLVGQAEGGTLFLDEVETFSPKGQIVLLRFLQDFHFKALGSSRHKQADMRIVAASNVKLQGLVNQGEFRKDLFYRLDIMPIMMPPLSARGNDVVVLAEYFLNKLRIQYNRPEKRLDRDTMQRLTRYNWPGNIRELENTLHRAFLLSDGPHIRVDKVGLIPQERRRRTTDRRHRGYLEKNMREAKADVLRQFEIEYLIRLLDHTQGNVTKAAKQAGKERRALGKLIKKHGIDKRFPAGS